VGFEPTIQTPERAKAVHALDRLANVTGTFNFTFTNLTDGAGGSIFRLGSMLQSQQVVNSITDDVIGFFN
jgi:hypothetical protein